MDTGRRDAAPSDRGKGADSGAPGSSFRSENNFGTSAVVPGDPRAAEGGGDGSGDGAAGGDGAGSTGQVSGLEQAASALDTGETSSAQNYLLLVLIAGGGVLLGVTSARARATE